VLLGRTFVSDLAEKHGALLGIAELSTALCSLPDKLVCFCYGHFVYFVFREDKIADHLMDTIVQQLVDIVPKVNEYNVTFYYVVMLVGKIGSIERCRRRCDETCRYRVGVAVT